MTAMNRNSRTGRRYDREFKDNVVALVRSGRTVTEVARDQPAGQRRRALAYADPRFTLMEK